MFGESFSVALFALTPDRASKPKPIATASLDKSRGGGRLAPMTRV